MVVTANNSGGSASTAAVATAVVAPAPSQLPPSSELTTVFTGSLNSKNPSRSFSLAMGSGVTDAKLSFTRCSSLSLGLGGPGMSATAPITGPSVLVLDATVAGGSYAYTVGGGKCSFTLTVRSPAF